MRIMSLTANWIVEDKTVLEAFGGDSRRSIEIRGRDPEPPRRLSGEENWLWDHIKLFHHLPSIREFGDDGSEEYAAFSSKKDGLPVKVACYRRYLEKIPTFGSAQNSKQEEILEILMHSGPLYMIPLETPSGAIAGFQYRPIRHKSGYAKYISVGNPKRFPLAYGWYGFRTFQRGDTIVISEGIKDSLYIQTEHPYVLAVGSTKVPYELFVALARLGKRILVAYDNDKAGNDGANALISALAKYKVEAVRLAPPSDWKDWGQGFKSDPNRTALKKALMSKVSSKKPRIDLF